MATITVKDALIALLKAEIENLEDEAVPIEDYYIATRNTYRFDVTSDEIKRYMRYRIRYRPCKQVQPPDMALLEPETLANLRQFSIKP